MKTPGSETIVFHPEDMVGGEGSMSGDKWGSDGGRMKRGTIFVVNYWSGLFV